LGVPDRPEDYLDSSEQAATGPDVDTRMRNNFTLRSREDVPHYLRPLEKKATGLDAELMEKKEQFSGDRLQFLEQERFAWNLIENQKQAVVNSVALPTATELMFRKGLKAAEDRQKELVSTIEELYGKQGETEGQQVDHPEAVSEKEAAKWVDESRRKDWDFEPKEVKDEAKTEDK